MTPRPVDHSATAVVQPHDGGSSAPNPPTTSGLTIPALPSQAAGFRALTRALPNGMTCGQAIMGAVSAMAINVGADVEVEQGLEVRVNDGTRLCADVYRPRAPGPHPVLVVRTPYDKLNGGATTYCNAAWYAAHGYIVVVQDVRGRHASQGTFYPLVNEEADGAPTVDWAAALPGSNGRVGMYGGSYPGWVQLAAAVSRPRSLYAIAPANIAADGHRWAWRDGAFNLAFALSWGIVEIGTTIAARHDHAEFRNQLREAQFRYNDLLRQGPLRDLPILTRSPADCLRFLVDWMDHPSAEDPYWTHIDFSKRYDDINVPGLHIGGWYDMFIEGTIAAFREIQEHGGPAARGRQRLIVGPWWHNPWVPSIGELDFGPNAISEIDELQVRWFDRWLKERDNGVEDEAPIKLFLLGTNRWADFDEFPPPNTRELALHLRSRGRANSMYGDGTLTRETPHDEPPDTYAYDPEFPTPSIGGRSCCDASLAPMGPYDQRSVEQALTVLCYDSELLEHDVTVIGRVVVDVYAASTSSDTDFVAKLIDVHPDGRAINLVEGITRTGAIAEAGTVGRYEIDLGFTAAVLRVGHRVRVEVSSSAFPFYDRNHNNGSRDTTESLDGARAALQTIFHDCERPSRVVLPIVSGSL